MVETLNRMEIKFKSYNILQDFQLKEWLKVYAQWQQYPMLFINGNFVGGTEFVTQMVDNESFTGIVPKECIRVNVIDRIKGAVGVSIVVLFMKGDRKNPKDGY